MDKRRSRSTSFSSPSSDDHSKKICHKRKRGKASTKNEPALKPSTFKRSRSTSSDTSSSNESKKKKKKKRKDKKESHSKKKHKKKHKKHKRKKDDSLGGPSKLETKAEDDCDIPLDFMDKSKAMAPMTKEQWEAQQSVVRRVYDESTGRSRYIMLLHKVKDLSTIMVYE